MGTRFQRTLAMPASVRGVGLSRLPHPHELHAILPEGDCPDLRDCRPQARGGEAGAGQTDMTPLLFLAQRISAVVLAFAVAIHLATIVYAVRGGLTAAEVLGRTRGNGWFLAVYVVFVIAVAIHAPIGLRNIAREWTAWRGRSLDVTLALIAALLLALGLRAALAVYLP